MSSISLSALRANQTLPRHHRFAAAPGSVLPVARGHSVSVEGPGHRQPRHMTGSGPALKVFNNNYVLNLFYIYGIYMCVFHANSAGFSQVKMDHLEARIFLLLHLFFNILAIFSVVGLWRLIS